MQLPSFISALLNWLASGFVGNLAAALVYTISIFLVGNAFNWIRHIFSYQHPMRGVWGLGHDRGELCLVVATIHPEVSITPLPPTTGLGGVHGAMYVAQAMMSAYPKRSASLQLIFSEEFMAYTDQMRRQDIVSLGGPKYNALSRALDAICRDSQPNGVRPIDLDLSDPQNVQVLTDGKPLAEPAVRDKVDYAIITHMVNPWDSSKVAILLEGVFTYGVGAAAQMLTAQYVNQLRKPKFAAVIRTGRWQALVKVEIVGGANILTLVNVLPLA